MYTRADAKKDLLLLPQAKYINEKNIEKWLHAVLRIDPDRLDWHVRRLSGIGGSEIGVLLGEYLDNYHPFSSAKKICGAKLLEFMPEEPNGDMMRGTEMEDTAQTMFRRQMAQAYPTYRPRDDLLDLMRKHRDSEFSWLIGTPDDIIEIDGKVIIVDYKVPNMDQIYEYDLEGAPFYYVAQLHHYRTIAERAGIEVGGLKLGALNYKEWKMNVYDVEYSKEMAETCLQVGRFHWEEFVLKGILPESRSYKEYKTKEVPEEIKRLTRKYAIYNAMASHANNMKKRVKDMMSSYNIDDLVSPEEDVIKIDNVNLAVTRQWNDKAILEYIKSNHSEIDVSIIDNPAYWLKGDLDQEKILEHLVSLIGAKDITDPKLDFLRKPDQLHMGRVLDILKTVFIKNPEKLKDFILNQEHSLKMNMSKSGDVAELTNFLNKEAAESQTALYKELKEKTILRQEQQEEAEIASLVNKHRKNSL